MSRVLARRSPLGAELSDSPSPPRPGPGFLIVWQQDRLGRSNLEPRIPKGTPRRERFRLLVAAPMTTFEYTLIGANAIIVSGSSIMTGSLNTSDSAKQHRQESTGKGLRAFPSPPRALFSVSLTAGCGVLDRHLRNRHFYRPRPGRRARRLLVVPETWRSNPCLDPLHLATLDGSRSLRDTLGGPADLELSVR